MVRPTRGASARHDRDVGVIVRQYLIEHAIDLPEYSLVPTIYEHIKNSNSSLARLKKGVLEPAIEKAVERAKADKESDQDIEMAGHSHQDRDTNRVSEPHPDREMNRLIVRQYGLYGQSGQSQSQDEPKDQPTQEPKDQLVQEQRDQLPKEPTPLKRKRLATDPKENVDNSRSEKFAGLPEASGGLFRLLYGPLKFPNINNHSLGVLIHGASGSGKTLLVKAMAAHLRVHLHLVSGASLHVLPSEDAVNKLRRCFERAKRDSPSILFIDNLDLIASRRGGQQRSSDLHLSPLLIELLYELRRQKGAFVAVLAATAEPDLIDPDLRTSLRLDHEVKLVVPNLSDREAILKVLTEDYTIGSDVDLRAWALRTSGFVGADLGSLVCKAYSVAQRTSMTAILQPLSDSFSEGSTAEDQMMIRTDDGPDAFGADVAIKCAHFDEAIKTITSYTNRQGFSTIPTTSSKDVGALRAARKALDVSIVKAIRQPELWKDRGGKPPSGVLLWGPPGCGKTLLAKFIANQAQANFISVKGPELLSKYVGDSELAIRQLFTKARKNTPCLIFFDELDALAPKRGDSLNPASSRVVAQLLCELDGFEGRDGIFVMGATNRPEEIDEAAIRPGRFEKVIFVDLPSADEREDIMRTIVAKNDHIQSQVSDEMVQTARECHGFSGADLHSLVSNAVALSIDEDVAVGIQHVREARSTMKPSIKNHQYYKDLEKKLE